MFQRLKLALEAVWLILWCGNLPDAEEAVKARTNRIAELEAERDVWKARFEECGQHWTNEIEEADRVERDLKERLTSAADALETERTRANAAERLAARAEEDLNTERARVESNAIAIRGMNEQIVKLSGERKADMRRIARKLAEFIEDAGLKNEIWCGWTYPNTVAIEPAGSLSKPLSAIVDTAAISPEDAA